VFDTELKFFIENQASLVAKYPGKVLVIKGKEVVGAYPSPLDAFNAGSARFKPGTFMIQPCDPGPGAYTVTIASSTAGESTVLQ
jgi:hypothetical protein